MDSEEVRPDIVRGKTYSICSSLLRVLGELGDASSGRDPRPEAPMFAKGADYRYPADLHLVMPVGHLQRHPWDTRCCDVPLAFLEFESSLPIKDDPVDAADASTA